MENAFFIVGPTAVGKTGLAVELAEQWGAEIINADAYQVYRGFDLLTAKPTPEQMERVAHHLVGCLATSETYNVARYLQDACACKERIAGRGKTVIVAGGNGLYVKALTHGLSPVPAVLSELRVELEALSLEDLLARLRAHDPGALLLIDVQNKRRVVRALEVCIATGKPFAASRTEWRPKLPSPRRGVFLIRDRAELVSRIDDRIDAMFARGVVDEVRMADMEGSSSTARQILGLADIRSYLGERMDLATCRERIKVATRQYAKRQVTWFKREDCFVPINLSGTKGAREQINKLYDKFSSNEITDATAPGIAASDVDDQGKHDGCEF